MTSSSSEYAAAAQLRAALRRLASSTEQVAREHELTSRRYELLLFVGAADETGGPATVTSLCDPLGTTQASVTQLVNGAVRAGLLQRTPSSSDKRSHHLHLTPLGAQRLREAFNALGPERERLAEIIGEHFAA